MLTVPYPYALKNAREFFKKTMVRQESTWSILKFGFNRLKLRRIPVHVFVGNTRSGRPLEKFGFKEEGLERKAGRCKVDGKIKDGLIYGLIKEEWAKNPKNT